MSLVFNPECCDCPRLSRFRLEVKTSHPDYHALPVAPFGAAQPELLIVGLAPGMHGANRTGRPFTGDFAGILLYETLHRFGFSNQPNGTAVDDGLQLKNCRITNAVKCLPPANKPENNEILICNNYLRNELNALHNLKVILALGNVAHRAALLALNLKAKDFPFGHKAAHSLPNGPLLYDSYHCSRYNTQTKRLTREMFEAVFAEIRSHLSSV